jgi:hypothetical protein
MKDPNEMILVEGPNLLMVTRGEFANKVEQASGFRRDTPVIETRTGKDLRGTVAPRLIGFPSWVVPVTFDQDPEGEPGTIRAVDPGDLIVDPEPRQQTRRTPATS